MLLVLTVTAFLIIAWNLTARIWLVEAEELMPLERVAAVITIGFALWLASIWVLAIPHLYVRPLILLRTSLAVTVAIALCIMRRTALPRPTITSQTLLIGIASLPIVFWVIWILWRGWLVPPLSHDALSYHLPKAILFLRLHGFAYLDLPGLVTRKLPPNYELLLSDIIALEGSDQITEWLSTLFYVGFVLVSGALVQRWWRSRPVADATILLLIAGSPILLLHSGAHKNDVMAAMFMIASMVWGGRYYSRGEHSALAMFILASVAGAGTKPQAGVLVLAFAPAILWRMQRDLRSAPRLLTPKRVVALVSFGMACVFLLGGYSYLTNLWAEHSFGGHHAVVTKTAPTVLYGDWANLWQGPWVLLTGPFSPWTDDIWVPGEASTWFWKRHEIYFGHLGVPFALCALLLPLGLWYLRHDEPLELARERLVVSVIALVTFVALLPVVFYPHGFYPISLPRYALFILPVTFACTLGPLLRRIEAVPFAASAVMMIASLWVSADAIDNAVNDRFCPIKYVAWVNQHRGTRSLAFPDQRSEQVIDHLAGPTDKVAVDSDGFAWSYPAFGAALQRPVYYIAETDGTPAIPRDATWVAIDRGFNAAWLAPRFTNLSLWRKYLGKGSPTERDLYVLRYMLKNPRYGLIYLNPHSNQAVFRLRQGWPPAAARK
jgi:hypothetical protein